MISRPAPSGSTYMRLSVTVGFRALSRTYRPHAGLTACSCSYGRALAPDFFRLSTSRYPLCPSLRFSSRFPINSFQLIRS